MDPLVKGICRDYAGIIHKPNNKNHVPFYALFDHDYFDAHEAHHPLILKGKHMSSGQKQMTPQIVSTT